MMRLLLFFTALAIVAPARAQHQGHGTPPKEAPAPTARCTPEHAAMGHCTPAAPPARPVAATCTPEHAAMGHCTLPPGPPAPPGPACTAEHAAMGHCKLPPSLPPPESACMPEHAAMGHCALPEPAKPGLDPHAGHASPSADPHAAHGAAGPGGIGPDMAVGSDRRRLPQQQPPPAALKGPEHAADAFFSSSEMAAAREDLRREHGDIAVAKVLIDQLEARLRNGRDGYFVNAEAWYGGDTDKLWLKSEVEGEFRENPEQAEVRALWSHAIDPWFDLQAGLRYDFEPAGRARAVLGIQGLAPYWFEIDGALFLSEKGDLTARLEAEYDLRITQRLILQPRAEVDLAAQTIAAERLGAGLATAEIGLRLRYALSPQFAPYVGLEYDRAFSKTRRLRRAAGDDTGGIAAVVGIRAWF